MNATPHPGYQAIQQLLTPLVRWCLMVGIGHGQLSRLSKSLFYEAAKLELQRKGLKITDSALSLASGLHKGDIDRFNRFNRAVTGTSLHQAEAPSLARINPASQVIARWIATELETTLPIRGQEHSFEALVKATQQEGAPLLSTRLILKELERRQLVEVQDKQNVRLISSVGLPAIDQQEAVVHFVGAVRDHLMACLHNLEAKAHETQFLEQSLNVDSLSSQSVVLLHEATRQWWNTALIDLANRAIAMSENDKSKGCDQCLRIGVYVYSPALSGETHTTHP